jgi:hypothetical protein
MPNEVIHRIHSQVLKDEGHRFETFDRDSAERRLKEVLKRDPRAVILSIPKQR